MGERKACDEREKWLESVELGPSLRNRQKKEKVEKKRRKRNKKIGRLGSNNIVTIERRVKLNNVSKCV